MQGGLSLTHLPVGSLVVVAFVGGLAVTLQVGCSFILGFVLGCLLLPLIGTGWFLFLVWCMFWLSKCGLWGMGFGW